MPMNDVGNDIKPGRLYVVATPIGNMDDITLRALKILRDVDQIAAEDTRKTRRFLNLHNIKSNLISYHEHNEAERTPKLMAILSKGKSIALVCNAGTPTISDPGYRLIEAALDNNFNVIPIPGVSAAAAALSVAGLPTDSFIFMGFLPKKKTKRLRQLNQLAGEPRTIIFYESPKRLLKLLAEIKETMGNRKGVLAREMTKLHEEFIRGSITDILKTLKRRASIKGECTLLVAGFDTDAHQPWDAIRENIKSAVLNQQDSLSTIAKNLAKNSGIAKSRIYEEALKISEELDNEN